MRDFLFVAGLVAAVIGVILIISVGAVFLFNKPTCEAETSGMKLQHRWSFWGDCQVLTEKDGWVPLENYRSFK